MSVFLYISKRKIILEMAFQTLSKFKELKPPTSREVNVPQIFYVAPHFPPTKIRPLFELEFKKLLHLYIMRFEFSQQSTAFTTSQLIKKKSA